MQSPVRVALLLCLLSAAGCRSMSSSGAQCYSDREPPASFTEAVVGGAADAIHEFERELSCFNRTGVLFMVQNAVRAGVRICAPLILYPILAALAPFACVVVCITPDAYLGSGFVGLLTEAYMLLSISLLFGFLLFKGAESKREQPTLRVCGDCAREILNRRAAAAEDKKRQ